MGILLLFFFTTQQKNKICVQTKEALKIINIFHWSKRSHTIYRPVDIQLEVEKTSPETFVHLIQHIGSEHNMNSIGITTLRPSLGGQSLKKNKDKLNKPMMISEAKTVIRHDTRYLHG